MKIVFRGTVEHGALKIYNPDFISFLRQFEGKVLFLTIQPEKRPRSVEQNKYYWGVVIDVIGRHLGYSAEEAHEALKWHFLIKLGEVLPTVKSTTELTTVEFEEYLAKIRQWAAEFLNVSIPEPNEVEV